MGKGITTGFRLTDDYLKIVDNWCSSTELNRSEVVRLAIKHLKDHRLENVDLDEYKFVENVRSKSTND